MAKALFFDIDGTLLYGRRGEKHIGEGTLPELHRMKQLGNRIFLSSGRPRMLLDQELLDMGFDGFVLANGGHVEIGDESIYEERMGGELALRAADLVESLGFEYTINTAHHTYLPRSYGQMIAYFQDVSDRFTYDFDRTEALSRAIKLEMFPTMSEREHIRKRVSDELGDDVAFNNNGARGTFELYSSRLSKATGIQMVLDYFGIAREDSYGFGDGTNDLSMIRYCGTGIAMGNACDELKAAADLVCGRVEEDGLARALRELFPE